MIRLTLDLESSLVEILDRIVRDDGKYETDEYGRRQAIVKLLLEHSNQQREGAHQKAGAKDASKSGRDEFAVVRSERDALRKALEAERATRRRDRERHAASRDRLRSAQAAGRRLSESRAVYRDLALRVEAALLRAPPREDFGGLEGRLGRALRAAGFQMPAAPDR